MFSLARFPKSFIALTALQAISLLLTGCGKPEVSGKQSGIYGHFEKGSPEHLATFTGKLTFVPEYEVGQNVLVSSQLFDLQGFDQIHALVEAGAPRIFLLADNGPNGLKGDALALKQKAREDAEKSLIARGIALTYSVQVKLDTIFAKVQVIEQTQALFQRDPENRYSTVWARDWSPFAAKHVNGSYKILDFNYYHDRNLDDTTPSFVENFRRFKGLPQERVSVPLYIEGGNFMNTDAWCFMSSRVIQRNSAEFLSYKEEDVIKSGGLVSADTVFDAAAIKNMFSNLGCKNTQIFERLPYEGTGHIDMWTKVVSANTVLVGDVTESSLERAQSPAAVALLGGQMTQAQYLDRLRETQTYLRTQQAWFAEHGFKVIKMPMPLNLFIYSKKTEEWYTQFYVNQGKTPEQALELAKKDAVSNITRSYTNSLLINRTLVTPRYERIKLWEPTTSGPDAEWKLIDMAYPDEDLLPEYEQNVKRALENAGFKVRFVATDELISSGGSVHCTTMQVPW